VQNTQINSPLDIELEAPGIELLTKGSFDAEFFPQSTEDQIGPDSVDRHRFSLSGGVSIDHSQVLAESGPGTKQGIELAGGLEKIQASKGGKNPLADVASITVTLHDLEVGIGARAFDSEEHAGWSLPPRM
jgi:hypothetical protein